MTTEKKKLQPQLNTRQLLKVMREGQVCPDGVVIDVNWDAMTVGMSLFVPAVNLAELDKQVKKVANRRKITVKGVERIENGKLGMRFWRLL